VSQFREYRVSKGFSLRGLARAAGISKTTLLAIESGASWPRMATRQKLAAALGVTHSEVIDVLPEARRSRQYAQQAAEAATAHGKGAP
jgi:transcriptional regulator with XRE-family HTH domain